MEEIKKFILNEYKYNCMMWGIKCVPYEEFYNWNIKCLNESPEDVVWLNELCKRMSNSKIHCARVIQESLEDGGLC